MKIRLGELRRVIVAALLVEAPDDDEDEAADDGGDEGDDLFDDAAADAADDDGGGGDEEGEEQAAKPKDSPAPEGSSLDSQVDRQFIGFEKEASGKGLHAEGRDSFRAMTRRFLLREADDAPELPADADGDGDEGSDGKFDPAAFAGMVARLVENFDTVIDVRQTLARRALGFLKKMRDPEEVERVKAALADQHGIDTELTGDEREADFQAPAAAGAGPTGA